MDHISMICGLDENGIYLIEKDPNVTRDFRVLNHPLGSRLILWNPKDGTTTVVKDNVLAAHLIPSQQIFYYLTAVASSHQIEESQRPSQIPVEGYLLSLWRGDLQTGVGTHLFDDDRTDPSCYFSFAFGGTFVQEDQRLYAEFYYPYPSEVPYARRIEIVEDGIRIDDTELEQLEKSLLQIHPTA